MTYPLPEARYVADDDAPPLDAAVTALAQYLHESGRTEDAEEVALAMAHVREAVRGEAAAGGPLALYDALTDLALNTASIARIVSREIRRPR